MIGRVYDAQEALSEGSVEAESVSQRLHRGMGLWGWASTPRVCSDFLHVSSWLKVVQFSFLS